ncbi:hypothetical protein BDFG_06695 [Blastomyces dermatitidis ATCC 26199]|nr:hypothetical protein BDFG_06695 [Blastomyces dermatitidis ATCC 26199]
MTVREVRNEPDMNKLISRRDDISLQGTVTITMTVKEAGGEGDVIMRVMLSQLIDAAASAFNLTFLAVTEAVTTP